MEHIISYVVFTASFTVKIFFLAIIFLHLIVPPMMWVPDQQMSALAGSSVELNCYVESHPEALVFWEHDGRMVQPSDRAKTIIRQSNPSYKVKI